MPPASALAFMASQSVPVAPGAPDLARGRTEPGSVLLDPYLYPPPGSTTFNLAAEAAVSGAGAAVTPAGLQYQIPANNVGVVDALSLLLNGITLSSVVTWRVIVGGLAVQGWDNLTILGRDGAQAISVAFDKCRIVIPQSASLGISITDTDGAAYTVGAQLRGWFWPVTR